jgi:hypothetical protein
MNDSVSTQHRRRLAGSRGVLGWGLLGWGLLGWGLAWGVLAGALLGTGVVFTAAPAVAERSSSQSARPLLDATHLPPLLTIPGERVELRYDIHCVPIVEAPNDAPCAGGGTVFVRAGDSGRYRELPLAVDPNAVEGRHVARVPEDIASSRTGFTYYATIRGEADGATLELPAGGADAPQRSLPLERAVDVSLGAHAFGATRRADARVAEARWGQGSADVGLESGRNLSTTGGSSFDVDRSGTVDVLDQVHRRILRWPAGASAPVVIPLSIDGTVADLSVDEDGTMYVLEAAVAGRGPLLRAFGARGEAHGILELGERTAAQVRIGPDGPIVLQHPSAQWMRAIVDGRPLDEAAQGASGRPGRALPGGGEVIVLRRENEIRAALTSPNGVRRSWRVRSETPVAEVQLAEPLRSRLLLVVRLYSDTEDEFRVLVLGPKRLDTSASLDSADWAETAPLSRFRLSGSSLYQLGSTPAGLFVDRFDMEVK